MGGSHLSRDSDALNYLARNNIIVNLSPARDIFFKVYTSYREFPIRKFLDAGVKVSIGTNSLFVYQKTISEQCAALYNAGVLSEEEIKTLLSQSLTL
jgi:Adenosine deaminase